MVLKQGFSLFPEQSSMSSNSHYFTNSDQAPNGNAVALGIGIGVLLGVLLICSIVFFLVWQRYKRKLAQADADLETQMSTHKSYMSETSSMFEPEYSHVVRPLPLESFSLKEFAKSTKQKVDRKVRTPEKCIKRPVITVPRHVSIDDTFDSKSFEMPLTPVRQRSFI